MRGSLIALLLVLVPPPLAAKEKAPHADMTWAFQHSDVPVDPAFRFGRLENGMRYVIRRNATPAGTAVVRLNVEVGSLDEGPAEQGFAHFVEHMAFNGSTRVPEGQMVPLLEREGLAFGADTNASTSFERTVYKLDLPRNDPALIDTALMLMRETAGNLTIAQAAVDRERGVILSEMRDRNSWALRNAIESTRFFYPGSLYAQRFPIGTAETLQAASAASLRAFYEREYVPAHTTLVIVGDFDVDAVEAGILRHFNDWAPKPAEPQPAPGPFSRKDRNRASAYLDPALSERVTVQRNGTSLHKPDTIAERRERLLRSIGYDIVNRRLQRLARSAQPPFRGAGFGTGDVFKAARSTRLIVDTVDGKWRAGLEAAGREYRRALAYGFSEAEVAEQVAQLRTASVNAAAAASTRSNAMLAQLALTLVEDRLVPSTPQSSLERFEAFAPDITPAAVLAALKREALALDAPLIRFQGRQAPEGGEAALQAAWNDVMHGKVERPTAADTAQFAYTDFGPPGQITSDTRRDDFGLREVRFANGVMLNLKRTDLEKDRVRVSLSIDGGDRLNTRDNPHATQLVPNLEDGGLGRHSRDELDTILAGRSVSLGLGRGESSFDTRLVTTPRDLEIQLQLLTALITDPGYRPEGEVRYRQAINNFFAQLDATPASALGARLGAILSDSDPRFSLGDVEAYRQLTYAKLRNDIGDRLAKGAVEIALVGDIDEDTAIALVARTFGALPPRERGFHEESAGPPRPFTRDRSLRIVRHSGPADQALLRITWPTRDDSDAVEALALEMLERVMRVELTDQLREALGKAYSPSAASSLSRGWKGYGTFSVNASIDVTDVPATRKAIAQVVDELRAAPVSEDILRRARQPLIEAYQNALKTNGGWMALAARAQSQPDRIERFRNARDRLLALTPADVQAVARRYLVQGAGVEVLALPKDAAVPAPTS